MRPTVYVWSYVEVVEVTPEKRESELSKMIRNLSSVDRKRYLLIVFYAAKLLFTLRQIDPFLPFTATVPVPDTATGTPRPAMSEELARCLEEGKGALPLRGDGVPEVSAAFDQDCFWLQHEWLAEVKAGMAAEKRWNYFGLLCRKLGLPLFQAYSLYTLVHGLHSGEPSNYGLITNMGHGLFIFSGMICYLWDSLPEDMDSWSVPVFLGNSVVVYALDPVIFVRTLEVDLGSEMVRLGDRPLVHLVGVFVLWLYFQWIYDALWLVWSHDMRNNHRQPEVKKESKAKVKARPKKQEEQVIPSKMKIKLNPKIYPEWLFHACLYDHKDQVKKLLHEKAVDINAKSHFGGNTPLHLACSSGSLSVVQVILHNRNQKANLYLRNDNNKTPIHCGVASGHWEVVKRIVEHKLFKWKHVDFHDLVGEAAVSEQYDLACKLLTLQPEFSFKDPNIPIYLQRCKVLSNAINGLPAGDKKAQAKKRDLNAYKKHLEATFRKDEHYQQPEVAKAPSSPFEEAVSLLECCICFDEMLDSSILACSNDHWICQNCSEDGRVRECPVCRQNFRANPPQKRYTVEKLAGALKNLKSMLEAKPSRYG